tara:strand:+ start:267 stop:1106 length:840 start_codon:yes stop_codon:yes gene_type:complete
MPKSTPAGGEGEDNTKEKGSSCFKSPLFIFGGITVLFFVYGVWVFDVFPRFVTFQQWSDKGTFGDSWEMLTALFSALAFGGLLITIFQQQANLKLTRDEICDTRDEMKLHQFENTFFKMLETYNRILSDLDLKLTRGTNGNTVVTGTDCIRMLLTILKSTDHKAVGPNFIFDASRAKFPRIYEEFWHGRRGDLGHYYRFMYNTIKYINSSNQSDQVKKQYIKIFQSQLSDYKLVLLFYNSNSTYGEKSKVFIEKYHLLSNLPDSLLFNIGHKEWYRGFN